jgi:type I restriction enzyme S subunit
MHTESPKTTLGVEVDLLSGFPFSSKAYTEDPSDVRLLRGDNIAQGYIRWANAKRWPHEDAHNFEQYELRKDDVVLAMDRPWIDAGLKYAAISERDLPCLLLQRTARLRCGQNLDNQFLRYLVGSPEFTRHIQSITTGSLVRVRLKTLHSCVRQSLSNEESRLCLVPSTPRSNSTSGSTRN